MPTARLCPLADVAALIPADCWMAERLAQDPDALAEETVLWITGDVHWPELHLDAPLASGSPQRLWWEGLQHGAGQGRVPRSLFLILIDGSLQIDGALTCDDTDGATHLIVRGDTQVHGAVVGGQLLYVQGTLRVDDLLWGHYNHGELRVRGGLQARVALFTDEYGVDIEGPEQVEFLLDEVRPGPHLGEFSAEVLGAVFAAEFLSDAASGQDGLASMLDRPQVVAAVRAGDSAVRSTADIHGAWPMAHDLCADNTISVENILAVVHTPVIAHKEHKAYGWFHQTDFSICQRHVDEDGDQRDDNVFITVWKTWDFYLSVEQPRRRGPLARLAAALLRQPQQAGPELTLLYRGYDDGEPGDWKPLSPSAAPEAWEPCQKAWRGVLDYVRKAVGQHRARYPLYQRLEAEHTARSIEDFTSLPVFTERYNDWWDSERNGHWQGDVWVGARQPCMHDGEPWGRALKFSWENGGPAAGDDEDDAHSAYQIDVDEARDGPALVEFTYAQRQSDARAALPRGAADHVARLLRFYGQVQARLRQEHAREQAEAAEVRRIEAAVHLLATPPLAADVPDAAVFPLELLQLSTQWQADGQAYVAAIRSHQLSVDARRAQEDAAGDARSDMTDVEGADQGLGEDHAEPESEAESEAEADNLADDEAVGAEENRNAVALPSDPRKSAAPTVLQLARVVNAHGDDDLGERFRQRFAFAPDAFVRRADEAGTFIGPVFALEDGRVLARVGPAYDDGAHWVAVHGARHTALPGLRGLGRSVDRQVFAQSDGLQVTTHRGYAGAVIARFALPRGNEGLPAHVAVAAGATGQRCDELIPFNDGQRVLLRNPTGIYLLSPAGSGQAVQRLHPQTFDEDGPYTWPKNQRDEAEGADGRCATVLSLDMLHMALSPDERFIAVGDQDSAHVLLDARGAVLAEYDPLSSYPHHAAFSHDGTRLFVNSCHLYNGCTLSLPVPPQARADDAQAAPPLDTHLRVYAAATQPGMVIAGGAHGYLHAIGDDGQRLWRHHIGSSLSAVETSPDGSTLWAASYGGYLVQLARSEAGMDPYAIGTSPYAEASRWIFWSDEAGPLRW